MKKNKIILLIVALAAMLGATSCKTSEKNYKAAYDVAKAKNVERNKLNDDELFDKIEKEKNATNATINGEDVRMETMRVTITDGMPEQVRKYNIVAKEFKQVFNARSLRDRLKEEGHDSYVVFEGSNKFYYTIVRGFDNPTEAMEFVRNRDKHLKMKNLDLYILEAVF